MRGRVKEGLAKIGQLQKINQGLTENEQILLKGATFYPSYE